MNIILTRWINPYYLLDDTICNLMESAKAKPISKYLVLDNFYNEPELDRLIAAHSELSFSEEQDRRAADGSWLPYDGAVQFASRGQHVGSDLFFCRAWHEFCAKLVGTIIVPNAETEVKLRYHRPNADGFWIHSDRGRRQMVIISYFNRGWRATDGGLLQLWRIDETNDPTALVVDDVAGRLDFLVGCGRLRTRTPGGGFPDNAAHDLVLVDQIVPIYNRVFICDFQHDPAYHSVTPSGPRARTGVVQWVLA